MVSITSGCLLHRFCRTEARGISGCLHDTDYTPLFGSETPVPKTAKKGQNVLQKIEGVLTSQGAELMLGGPRQSQSNCG